MARQVSTFAAMSPVQCSAVQQQQQQQQQQQDSVSAGRNNLVRGPGAYDGPAVRGDCRRRAGGGRPGGGVTPVLLVARPLRSSSARSKCRGVTTSPRTSPSLVRGTFRQGFGARADRPRRALSAPCLLPSPALCAFRTASAHVGDRELGRAALGRLGGPIAAPAARVPLRRPPAARRADVGRGPLRSVP